jgi:CRP/FNR family transcriptional regulator, cyclic AMP receptor protein
VHSGETLTVEQQHGEPLRWPSRAPPAARPGAYRYLLDLDPDLADELDVRLRLAARPAMAARILEVDSGEVDLSAWITEAAPGPGLLVLDGVLAGHVRVGDRVAAELIGPGDLIQPVGRHEDELVASDTTWRALVDLRLAVLDDAFAERVLPWPQITRVLLRRAGRRTRALNIQRAIAAQPRLDVRLALLLWHLATRWGKVEPGGIRLPVPLTHQLLGKLVGAERPSVSHALARLAHAGLVTGHGDEWHLHGTLEDHLSSMLEAERTHVRQLVADLSPLRF